MPMSEDERRQLRETEAELAGQRQLTRLARRLGQASIDKGMGRVIALWGVGGSLGLILVVAGAVAHSTPAEVAGVVVLIDAQRKSDIEAGAGRPARLILDDVRTAIGQLEDVWRRMPADAWSRPTAARIGQRPAWLSVWARWRESEIHHVDLDAGYAHGHWPAEFVDLLLPRVMPTLPARLDEETAVQVETIDRDPPVTAMTASTAGEPVIVRGPASAVLCWLLGRACAAAADLDVTRSGQAWPLPRLRAWA